MLKCPLCNAENPITAKACSICQTPLSVDAHLTDDAVTDTVDISTTQMNLRSLGYMGLVLALIALPWFLMSDLLVVPKRVLSTSRSFEHLVQRYEDSPQEWSRFKDRALEALNAHTMQRDATQPPLAFDNLPLEAFVALMVDELGFSRDELSHFSLYPAEVGGEPVVILAKKESGTWPLRITVSLEVGFHQDEGTLKPVVRRLRRGSRSVDPQLTDVYFSKELARLEQLSSFQGGVREITLQPVNGQHAPVVSLRYHQFPVASEGVL